MVTALLAGGGTGGHVFPMMAVGDALRSLDASARVVYVGTERGLEARVLPERGDELELLRVLPLRGAGVAGFVRGSARAAAVLPEAMRLVTRVRADVVLSVGGYAAGPAALAARALGVPIAILEPNGVLGLANRLLAPFIARAYVAFPEVERSLRPSVVRRTGVPLRTAFARAAYPTTGGPLRVLVLGGSQGASALNETVPRALAQAAARAEVTVVHQTGREREGGVRALYGELGLERASEVTPFIEDVAAALAGADLVIARAGASTLAEVCAVGRPSLLVPFPFAADDHQMRNARSLERAGAAVALAQADATAERVAGIVLRLAVDGSERARMAEAAAELGRPHAAQEVARDLLVLAREHEARRRGPVPKTSGGAR